MLPRSWRKSFDSGIIIPTKKRFCNECNDKKLCDKGNNQFKESKEVEANLTLFKRKAPNQFGYMLPFYEIKFLTFCTKSSIM